MAGCGRRCVALGRLRHARLAAPSKRCCLVDVAVIIAVVAVIVVIDNGGDGDTASHCQHSQELLGGAAAIQRVAHAAPRLADCHVQRLVHDGVAATALDRAGDGRHSRAKLPALELYENMPKAILQSDMFRYLWIYLEGGLYVGDFFFPYFDFFPHDTALSAFPAACPSSFLSDVAVR
jgi:hypothetical protein